MNPSKKSPPSLTNKSDQQDFHNFDRLLEVEEMVREISCQQDPQEMILIFRKYTANFFGGDGSISLSRRNLNAPQFRITRHSNDVRRTRRPAYHFFLAQELGYLDATYEGKHEVNENKIETAISNQIRRFLTVTRSHYPDTPFGEAGLYDLMQGYLIVDDEHTMSLLVRHLTNSRVLSLVRRIIYHYNTIRLRDSSVSTSTATPELTGQRLHSLTIIESDFKHRSLAKTARNIGNVAILSGALTAD